MSPKDGRSWRWVLFFRCLSYTFPILSIISTTMAAIVVCCCVEPFSLPFLSLSPFLSFLYHQHILHFSLILYLLLSTNVISLRLVPLRTIGRSWTMKIQQFTKQTTTNCDRNKKIASLRKITEQKERDRANDSQNEFDAKNGKYFVKYFEPWKKMRYIKISTKCRMEREWKKNEIGRRQTQNSIKNDVNSQIYRHLMLWRRIRVSIQMTIYSTSYSAILFFYLWLLRILFFSYFFYRHIALSLCW